VVIVRRNILKIDRVGECNACGNKVPDELAIQVTDFQQ
jgi:hypothetical protein